MFMSILCLKVRIPGPASWTTASAFLHTQLCVCLCRCRQKALTYVISSAGGEIQSLWRKATHNNDVIEALYAGEIFRQSKQTITTAGLCNKFSVPVSCPRPNKSSVFWNPSQQALCKQEAVCQHIASLGYSTETRELPLPEWQLKDHGGFMIYFLDWLHAHKESLGHVVFFQKPYEIKICPGDSVVWKWKTEGCKGEKKGGYLNCFQRLEQL